MLNWMKKISQIWGQDTGKIITSKIGTSLYPVLDKAGLGLNAPLALVVENENVAKAVFKELSGFGSPLNVPLGLPQKEFEKRMSSVSYELLPIVCSEINRQSAANLITLKNAMTSKMIKGEFFNVLPVIAFCGGIPQEFTDYLSGKIIIAEKQIINSDANSEEVVREIIESLKESWPIIDHRLQSLKMDRDAGLYFLRCSEEACRVLIEREADTDIRAKYLQEIDQTARKMEENWEISDNYLAWFDVLRDVIFKKSKYIIRIIDRKNAPYSNNELLKNYPLYDSKFYYLTPEFFEEVCGKLPYIGGMELKRALSDAGILIGEGASRSYFTVKVPVETTYGIITTSRRLRIVRSWLDLPGQLTWKDQIEMQRRK